MEKVAFIQSGQYRNGKRGRGTTFGKCPGVEELLLKLLLNNNNWKVIKYYFIYMFLICVSLLV